MLAVLDTNILISALFWRGAPYECLLAAEAGLYELVLADEILHELREKLVGKFQYTNQEADQILHDLRRYADVVQLQAGSGWVTHDPDDDKFVTLGLPRRCSPGLWYNRHMIKLTREQTEEAVRNPDGVECEGDGTEKTFIIVDADVLRRMREALYRNDVNESIAAGIADMEEGRMMTAEEADDRVRTHCGFPPRRAS